MREDSDMVYVFVGLFFTIFGGLNYYVGARGWQWLQSFTPVPVSAATYWAVFWLIALSFMVTRLTAGALPPAVTTVLAHVSAWWMAVFTIAVQVLLVVDIVRLLGRVAVAVAPQLAPARLLPDVNLVQVTGTVVCAAVVALVAFGAWRARTPVVTSYTVDIPKAAGPYSELHIVVVSDLHLGEIVGNSRIRRLAGIVGDLDPDLVLIPGDLIDDDLRPFIARGMAAELAALRPRLGTYASLGNHDPTPDRLAAYREALAPAGIKLLADEYVLSTMRFTSPFATTVRCRAVPALRRNRFRTCWPGSIAPDRLSSWTASRTGSARRRPPESTCKCPAIRTAASLPGNLVTARCTSSTGATCRKARPIRRHRRLRHVGTADPHRQPAGSRQHHRALFAAGGTRRVANEAAPVQRWRCAHMLRFDNLAPDESDLLIAWLTSDTWHYCKTQRQCLIFASMPRIAAAVTANRRCSG